MVCVISILIIDDDKLKPHIEDYDDDDDYYYYYLSKGTRR